MSRFFLHLHPQGNFPDGIFLPYNTREEAERQAAWEMHHGSDPELYLGVFEAPKPPEPKFGWVRGDDPYIPHLDAAVRKAGACVTPKQLKSRANGHVDSLLREAQEAEAKRLLDVHKAIREGKGLKGSLPGAGYSWNTGGTATAVPAALSAATAKTVVLLLSGATNQPYVGEFWISFDGVTASAVPVLCELVSGTAATAGTPRATLAAGHQERGWPPYASVTTCGDNYAAEPTVQLVLRKWFLTPNGGLIDIPISMGKEPTGLLTASTDGHTLSLRLTAAATVNAHAGVNFDE